MKFITLFLLVFTIGCSNKSELELVIINNNLKSLNVEKNSYEKYLISKPLNTGGKTILKYKLKNNSSNVYYFNIDALNPKLEGNFIKMDKVFFGIKNEYDLLTKVKASYATVGMYPSLKELQLEYLGYNKQFPNSNKNFVIYPNQTIYFEWFIFLPFGNLVESENYALELDRNKKYFAEIYMSSDSTNYKKTISRVDLQSIKENGYKVFHGTIKSKNKIPIKFVEPTE